MGAYHGSSKMKLAAIAAVEPLDVKLRDIALQWACRMVKVGDSQVYNWLQADPAKGTTAWHQGTTLYQPGETTDGLIADAF